MPKQQQQKTNKQTNKQTSKKKNIFSVFFASTFLEIIEQNNVSG